MERKLFHEGLIAETENGPYLIGKKCCKCGKIQFPAGKLCTDCLGKETEDVLMGQKGTLFSFTTTYGLTATMKPPFTVGYITTEENQRVFAPLRMEEGKEFRIGAKVELEIADLWEDGDTIMTGYQYKLVD